MQTSKECVLNAIEGKGPDRIPLCLDFDSDALNRAITENIVKDYNADILIIPSYDPEFVPVAEGYTQWGYKMETFGETMGEVKDPPLKNWENFENWKSHLPDFTAPGRYAEAKRCRDRKSVV